VASLFLDHNLSPELGRLLRRARHDARSARELHVERTSDAEILREIGAAGRIIVTADEDFIVLHRSAPYDHAGILIVPETRRDDLATLAAAIDAFIRAGRPRRNELFRYHPATGWVELP